MVEDLKGISVDELLKVLWAYRTTTMTPTRETPFSLSYGYEAMVPVEIEMNSLRRENYDPNQNNLLQRRELDFLEEKRYVIHNCGLYLSAAYCQILHSKVKPKRFRVGDLVLRKVLQNKDALDPIWKGYFKISDILAPGA